MIFWSQALLLHLPGGEAVQYLCVTIAALGSLAYITSYFTIDMSYTLVIFVTILTLVIDCDIFYWTHKRGMDFWNQFRLLTDNLYIVFGMVMYLSCSTRFPLSKPGAPSGPQARDDVHPKSNWESLCNYCSICYIYVTC